MIIELTKPNSAKPFTAEAQRTQRFRRGTGNSPLRFLGVLCASVVKKLLAITILLLVVTPAFAQKDSAETAPKGLLKIPVWVEEDGEKFWLDGNRQAFKVFVEEKETPLKSFQTPRSSTILLIVFDTVADLARVDQARTALNKAIKTLECSNRTAN